MYVILYVAAIVGANLTIAQFGPSATVIVAFTFIALDLVVRDRLHDRWLEHYGRSGLALRMGGLIALGGVVSYALNAGAARIALASCIAFAAAATVDAIVFHLLRRHPALVRVNGSNVPAAAIDSLLFPLLAFGAFLPLIVLGQFAAKVLGGAIWGAIIYRRRAVAVA